MIVYLASPSNQLQAEHLADMPVLLSYSERRDFLAKGYQQTFQRILADSGAYSEFATGKAIDLAAYADWAEQWIDHADAIAGLDDISGDWRRSLRNYESFPRGFPTFHESDPPELLTELIAMATERRQWLGIGLLPPRSGKMRFVRDTLDRIPEGIHVHGWAMRAYTRRRRLDSVDSTNWFRDALEMRAVAALSHLTFAECLDIVVKRYVRWDRATDDSPETPSLFATTEPERPAANNVATARGIRERRTQAMAYPR